MVILGLILLIIGLIANIGILTIIGAILLVVGLILNFVPIGGTRRRYYCRHAVVAPVPDWAAAVRVAPRVRREPPPAPSGPRRRAGRRTRAAARRAAARPVRERAGRRAGARDGAVAQPAALPRARRRTGGRRRVRRGGVPVAGLARRRDHRHPRRRPVGSRRARLAAARGARRLPRRAVGGDPGPTPRARADRRGGRPPAGAALLGGPSARRTLRVVRRAAAVAGHRLVRRAATPTAPVVPWRTISPGSPSSGVAWSSGSTAPSPVERHRHTVERAARGSRGVRPADAALAVRSHPALGDRDRPARGAGRRARRTRLAAASVAGALGTPRRAPGRRRARSRRQPPGRAPPVAVEPRTRHARAPAGARGRRARERHRGAVAPDHADTLLGWLQADLAADEAAPRRARPRPRRPLGAGARVSRRRPSGRRAARGAARAARRRPDPRAARRAGDVPRHRDLRPADRGRVRAAATVGRARSAAIPPTGCGSASPTARRCRPTRCSPWPAPCSTSRAGGRRRRRCSTSPGRSRCVGVSGSATTTSSSSTSGRASPGCGGPSTPSTAPTSASSSYVANTWEFGLDRLLTGVALSDDSSAWLDRALPLDDVGSAQVDLVGRLTEYVDRLRDRHRPAHRHPPARPLARRARRRGGVADRRVVAATAGSRDRCSASSAGSAARPPASARSTCGCPTYARCSSDRLAGRPTRANFRTGTLTVCTMVPMRSVPHRVVCLLGLDDGVFPRQGAVDGDDVLARDPMTGERDARSEDRQLLLDAILAATQTLVVTYTGANEFSGQPRPPAVPLGEVLDALDATASTGDGRLGLRGRHRPPPAAALRPEERLARRPRRRRDVLLRHRRRGRRAGRRRAAHAAGPVPRRTAAARRRRTTCRSPTWCASGATRSRGSSAATASTSPCAADEDQPEDALPVEIDSLAQWAVGDRVLADLLAGLDAAVVKQREWRRGELPPGQLGWRMLGQILDRAGPLHAAAAALRTHRRRARSTSPSTSAAVAGCVGTVPEVYGDRLVSVTYSRLGPKHRLASWVRLLALAASDDDRSWTAHTLGRPHSRSRDDIAVSLLGPLDHTARRPCCATWSRCVTAGCGRRCRCRSRRRSATPAHAVPMPTYPTRW